MRRQPDNMAGLICLNGRIRGVHLEDKGLNGRLDLAHLGDLGGLRTLSFMRNKLEGPMPDLSSLGALKAVYLSDNNFSGEIHEAVFEGTRSLKKVFLSRNRFSGPIPASLAALPKLIEARLDHNEFVGQIPAFSQPALVKVDVSFNSLEGAIPERLSKMDSTLFLGNDGLCGAPLRVSCDHNVQQISRFSPFLTKLIHRSGLSGWLIGFLILICLGILLILLVILANFRRRHPSATIIHPSSNKTDHAAADEAKKLEQGMAASSVAPGGKKCGKESGEHGRLVFVQEGRERFELHDLLQASAEVLGSGNFGSSYKAALSYRAVVVKRFKEMNGVGREDFNEHMRRLGRLSHPNILPLVAYYYKKEEKLLVSDFVANGSVARMLHGNRGSGLQPLDWPTRLKIVKGVARGLTYLHDELSVLSVPHGHLKSSNVLLNQTFEPLLADYALAPVMNATTASQLMVAYKSPEVAEIGHPSTKSDLWSLGILILEVLTGKFPSNFLHKGKAGGTDLAAWVSSMMLEERSSEVFDGDMRSGAEGQEEMYKLLKIGLDCCEENVGKRPDMREALQRIEQLNEGV
ncbi:putative LRR receptor-like serine/threonine-protein kinase RLK [Platanthera guangdongensis]|uniref:LRR receptor-like serine/threonine-protein kinase RLK n=1 Tax=Platanthera guangdongensis TaxID=2320717 RepID=A0ABR2MAJ9_9ASPA